MADSNVKEIKQPGMPKVDAEMAAWAVTKLDTEIAGLSNHQERNKFAAFINRLIEIANWKEPE